MVPSNPWAAPDWSVAYWPKPSSGCRDRGSLQPLQQTGDLSLKGSLFLPACAYVLLVSAFTCPSVDLYASIPRKFRVETAGELKKCPPVSPAQHTALRPEGVMSFFDGLELTFLINMINNLDDVAD